MVQIVHSTLIAQLSRKNLLIGLIKSTYIILTKYMYLKNDEHSMILDKYLNFENYVSFQLECTLL